GPARGRGRRTDEAVPGRARPRGRGAAPARGGSPLHRRPLALPGRYPRAHAGGRNPHPGQCPADPGDRRQLRRTPGHRRGRARAEDVAAGRLRPEQIDEAAVGARMALADLPPPDLFIRTGGDCRISNFLLWQLAYTELWFTPTLWPDLSAATLHEAIRAFSGR